MTPIQITVTPDDDFGSLVNHILEGTENLSAKQMYDRYLSPITCRNNENVDTDETVNVVASKKRPVDAVPTSDKAIKVNPSGTTNIQVVSKSSHPTVVNKQKPASITVEKSSDSKCELFFLLSSLLISSQNLPLSLLTIHFRARKHFVIVLQLPFFILHLTVDHRSCVNS